MLFNECFFSDVDTPNETPMISIFGKEKIFRAQVHMVGGFSAHTGQDDLLNWFSSSHPQNQK